MKNDNIDTYKCLLEIINSNPELERELNEKLKAKNAFRPTDVKKNLESISKNLSDPNNGAEVISRRKFISRQLKGKLYMSTDELGTIVCEHFNCKKATLNKDYSALGISKSAKYKGMKFKGKHSYFADLQNMLALAGLVLNSRFFIQEPMVCFSFVNTFDNNPASECLEGPVQNSNPEEMNEVQDDDSYYCVLLTCKHPYEQTLFTFFRRCFPTNMPFFTAQVNFGSIFFYFASYSSANAFYIQIRNLIEETR